MTEPPLYVTQMVDALSAASEDIDVRAGQRPAVWLITAHANRRTVFIECLPTGLDVHDGDAYLATKVDMGAAARTVRSALSGPGEQPAAARTLVLEARRLPILLREAGKWMARLAAEHPDTDLGVVQVGDFVLVLTPEGSAARTCGCGACDSLFRQALTAATGDPWHAYPARMIVCPRCGNKRCPRASHHDNECTGSNEPGQEGSVYA